MKVIDITNTESIVNHIVSNNVIGDTEDIKILAHKILNKTDNGRTKGVPEKLEKLKELGTEKVDTLERLKVLDLYNNN